jgi:Ala-tRNA(Pro) deacylase
VPPFGREYGLTTVVDTHLAGQPEVIVDGNTRHEGLRMRFRDYEAVERPIRARFATPISPPSRRRLRAAG